MHRLLAIALSGCTTWTTVDTQQHFVPVDGEPRIALRPDLLAGSAELLADATVGFELDRDHACRAIPQAKLEHTTIKHARISEVGWLSIALGTVGAITSIACCTQRIPADQAVDPSRPYAYSNATGFALGTASLALMLIPAIGGPSRAERHGVTEVSQDEVIVDDPTRVRIAPCDFDPVDLLGGLVLVTPWGDRVRSSLGPDGVARFAVSWTGDPDGDWQVMATRTPLAFAWRPTLVERDRMRALRVGNAQAAAASPVISGPM